MGAHLGRHLAEGHGITLFRHGPPALPVELPIPVPSPKRNRMEPELRSLTGGVHVKGSAHVPVARTSWFALDGEPGRGAAGCGASSIRRTALNACCAASARTTEASVA